MGSIRVDIPGVNEATDASLVTRIMDGDGRERARDDIRLAIVPEGARRTSRPLDVLVHDPVGIWGVAGRLEALGHRVVAPAGSALATAESGLLIATEMTDGLRDHVEAGGRALILVRNRSAIPEGHDLARRLAVHLRRLPHAGWPGTRSPWEGDWVTSWSWILHDEVRGLPRRNPLDFAYEEVLPDHVLLGYDPARHRDEVCAGMFVGWVNAPAALIWTFRQGRGAVTVTTFRVAPESGPVATLLLEHLVQKAAHADRRTGDRAEEVGAGSGAGAHRRP
jgi:hypothetical protein